MEEAVSLGAIPDINNGKLIVSFDLAGKRCDLLADCPVIDANRIPENLQFKFRYCLLIIEPSTNGLEGILCHEVSMFGTEAISFISKNGDRTNLGPASSQATPQRFLKYKLHYLCDDVHIFTSGQIEPVISSIPDCSLKKSPPPSFIKKFKIKRDLKSLMGKVDKVEGYVGGYVQMCQQLCAISLESVRQWDVTNPTLSAYLDYVFGVARFGCLSYFQENKESDLILDAFMVRVVGSQFPDLPLAKIFIEGAAAQIFEKVSADQELGLTPIFPMFYTVENGEHIWAKRVTAGMKDFESFAAGQIGVFPAGLFELGLIRGGVE